MPGRFDHRVVLVTGSARGIGFAVATRFAEDGAKIALCDLDAQAVEQGAARITEEWGVEATGYCCDVRDREQVESLVESVTAWAGSVDVLVNNAGVTRGQPHSQDVR